MRNNAEACGVSLYSWDELVQIGSHLTTEFEKCNESDYPIFSYTSGTTGDPKGVKLSHKNLLSTGASFETILQNLTRADIEISYLPLTHSFEQMILACIVIYGLKCGFY